MPNSHAPVVIAGGSGFVGTSLAIHLKGKGIPCVILSRSPPVSRGACDYVHWDGRRLGEWQQVLSGARALVNLAGRSVDCRKTPDHVDEILRSRVESTRVLGQAMRNLDAPPPVWVQMSTAHIYGDPPVVVCDEDSPVGWGMAPSVGQAWEGAFSENLLPQQRGVILRTSFVLGKDRGAGCGALSKLTRITRLGLGGTVGTGKQGISWIHERDMNRLIMQAIEHPPMQGVYVASSPQPVSQTQLMRELRRVLQMPIGLPARAWMVRLGATWLFNTDPELALYGRYVISRRLAETGFEFEYPALSSALREIFSSREEK